MKLSFIKRLRFITVLCFLIFLLTTCQKLDKQILIETGEIESYSSTSVSIKGNIVDLGEGVDDFGHIASTDISFSGNVQQSSLGNTDKLGVFSSTIFNLIPNTLYYVRAYAIKSGVKVYGNTILSFTTKVLSQIVFNSGSTYGTLSDVDGNIYKTIHIGSQIWMAENLRTTRYYTGDQIPIVTDNSTWASLSSPACCWYNNDINFKNVYGALYNWFTVNSGMICPDGWHVPDDNEWTSLTTYLGDIRTAGGKLKESGTLHWIDSSSGANNESGFTAVPAGYRDKDGDGGFYMIGAFAVWWSSTSYSPTDAAWRFILGTTDDIYGGLGGPDGPKSSGFSVRCVKN